MADRPPHVRPPAHLTPTTPVPQPRAVEPPPPREDGPDRVRYGDWERNGIAVDF